MRIQDIVIGETYRHKDNPCHYYAKAVKIINPRKSKWDLTEEEKKLKFACVKCEWSQNKNDTFGLIKYFRPCDLVRD